MRRAGAAIVALIVSQSLAAAGLLTNPEPLEKGAGRVTIDLTIFDAESFRSNGGNQVFPGTMTFTESDLRVTYAPWHHVAFGVTVPHRSARYEPGGGAEPIGDGGFAGFGAHADFNWQHGSTFSSFARAECLVAKNETDPVLTPSDSSDRLMFEYIFRRDGEFVWRAAIAMTILGETEVDPHSLEGSIEAAGGWKFVRLSGSTIGVLAVAGHRRSNQSREFGTALSKEAGEKSRAGAMVEWLPSRPGAHLRVSLLQDFAAEEALEGMRLVVSGGYVFDF